MDFTQEQIDRIHHELTPADLDALFVEYLDEINPMVEIGNLKYYPSRVLREVDPIAYGCAYSNWLDFELYVDRLIEVGDNYYFYDDINDLIDQMDGENEE